MSSSILHLILFLIFTILDSTALECYECVCYSQDQCNSACQFTIITESDEAYCTIKRKQENGISFQLTTGILNIGDKPIIKDPYSIYLQKSHQLNDSTQQFEPTVPFISFNCNWDKCNHPDLVSKLLTSFQLAVDDTYLNNSINGQQEEIQCAKCSSQVCGNSSYAPFDKCSATTCNGSIAEQCLVGEGYDNIKGDTYYCYASNCFDRAMTKSSVSAMFSAMYYLQKREPVYELQSVILICQAKSCMQTSLFSGFRENLKLDIDVGAFLRPSPPPSPPPPSTTPKNCSNRSTVLQSILILVLTFVILFIISSN
jgi:hypothetical protein